MKTSALHSAFAIAILCLLGTGCSRTKEQAQATGAAPAPRTHVKARLTWLYQSSYAPFLVAKEKGFYDKRGLDVEVLPSGPDLRPITTVAAGEDQIGVEGASAIIQAATNNVPIVVVGTYLQRSAEVFMTRKSDNLTDIHSWKGKKVGLWVGTHVEPLLYAMLAKAGMTKADVEIIPAKYDVVPFLQDGPDRVPIWNAYVYNEAQIPVEKGIAVDITTPESLGIQRAGEGIFASKAFAEKNPQAVAAFLAGTIEGIIYTNEHPDEAITILISGKYGTGFDVAHQKKMLAAALPLMIGPKQEPLKTDVELWRKTAATSFVDQPKSSPDVDALVKPIYWQQAKSMGTHDAK